MRKIIIATSDDAEYAIDRIRHEVVEVSMYRVNGNLLVAESVDDSWSTYYQTAMSMLVDDGKINTWGFYDEGHGDRHMNNG